MARARTKAKGRNGKSRYASIPHAVMDHPDFRGLSGSAQKVLMILLRQYNGFNNGDLSATFEQAQEWGIGGKGRWQRALKELQERDLIRLTRPGMFGYAGKHCALYAVTWHAVDECGGKLEVESTKAAQMFRRRVTKPRYQNST